MANGVFKKKFYHRYLSLFILPTTTTGTLLSRDSTAFRHVTLLAIDIDGTPTLNEATVILSWKPDKC